MSFRKDIEKFVENEKTMLAKAQKRAEQRFTERLEEVPAPDVHKITGGTIDLDSGTICDVQAPKDALSRLKAAGLIRD
ncbi:hypothetical protein [Massilia agri]|uniref:Uncharacterized protein n=1 Tax=Massilia agri TaxID=1886785 RepID=A0ABT2ATK4_9BURK|nr:hypothetical protein [Massilia agri]MCS0599573.1 hypothetical protein [Massilia agri]